MRISHRTEKLRAALERAEKQALHLGQLGKTKSELFEFLREIAACFETLARQNQRRAHPEGILHET